MRLLYFFSKTDYDIIEKCPASAKNVQATLGFFVLITGVLAFFSGSYAISNMFLKEDPLTGQPTMTNYGWLYSFLLGTVYTCFIVAIDREIVSASTKWAAALRIPLAIIISLVVATPVELKLFEGRINKHLIDQHRDDNESFENRLENQYRIPQLENEIADIKLKRQAATEKRDEWSEAAEAEVVGRVKVGRTGKPGPGTAYTEALRNQALQQTMIDKYDTLLKQQEELLAIAKGNSKKDFNNKKTAQSFDLLTKYIGLKEIKKVDKTGSASRMGLAITLLFCLFELIPAIMKVLTPLNEYDVLLEKRRRLNVTAIRLIYQQVAMEYHSMTVDEIKEYNPTAVEKMYEAQAR